MKIGYFKKYPKYVYGISFTKDWMLGYVKKRWTLVFFYGQKYRSFSNYPFNLR